MSTEPFDPVAAHDVLMSVLEERRRQHELFGEQNLPDGTGPNQQVWLSDEAGWVKHSEALEETRTTFAANEQRQCLSWADVLAEEFWEALCETDPKKLRTELLQVAAVAVAWVEHLDRRAKEGK